MRVLVTLLLLLSTAASASDLMGPIWHLRGKHIGDGESLRWSIDYYDQWGRTIPVSNGIWYHHDRLGGYSLFDSSRVMPSEYWNVEFPMYYMGTTMRYTVTLTNTDTARVYQHLRVVAIQEYYTEDDTWGERMGPDAAKDWYVPLLGPGESVVLEGSMWISENMRPGIDQTHIQVQHWTPASGRPGPGSVIIDDAKAALWCPPELGAASYDGEIEEGTAAEVTIAGGERGYVEAGQPAAVTVRTAEAGDLIVRVYDRRGLIVWEAAAFLGAGVVETFRWDGTDSSGSPVAPGVYMLVVQGPGLQAKEKIAVVR